MAASTAPTPCPSCGTPGTGRFCSHCGAPREGAPCAGCGAALDAGAKFCHRCGLAVGAAPAVAPTATGARLATAGLQPTPAQKGNLLPWAIAFVSLLGVVAFAASSNFSKAKGSRLDAPLNALPQAGLGDPGAAPTDAGAAGGAGGAPFAPFANGGAAGGTGRPPDLSQMTPRDIADRLFDRVMSLVAAGKADSAQFFAQMALQNYESMEKDLDLRYDMGRVAEVTGAAAVARAQADTILRANPNHLLGLVLAAKAAALQGRMDDYKRFQARLVAAAPAERAQKREEYERHANDIDAALRTAASPASPTGPAPK